MATKAVQNDNSPAQVSPQLAKLEALIAAANKARHSATHGMLFASHSGADLMDAIHDLTEVDGVFDLAGDVRLEIRADERGAS